MAESNLQFRPKLSGTFDGLVLYVLPQMTRVTLELPNLVIELCLMCLL